MQNVKVLGSVVQSGNILLWTILFKGNLNLEDIVPQNI